MKPITFIRLLGSENKEVDLRNSLSGEALITRQASQFSAIPGTPFAYWSSEELLSLFSSGRSVKDEALDVKQGIATADNFRFLRIFWEVRADNIGASSDDTRSRRGWVTYVKGGRGISFYSDFDLLINWFNDGEDIKHYINPITGKPYSNVGMLKATESNWFFRRGLTWPLRASRFFAAPMPEGSIFSVRGQAIFFCQEKLPEYLALFASSSFDYLYKLTLGRFGFPEFLVGNLKYIPIPHTLNNDLVSKAFKAIEYRRELYGVSESSRLFRIPGLFHFAGITLSERNATYSQFLSSTGAELERLQAEIDELAFDLYGLSEEDRQLIHDEMNGAAAPLAAEDGDEAVEAEEGEEDTEEGEEDAEVTADLRTQVERLLSWCVGAAFGRWDVRMALDPLLIPELQGPFERLPVVAPAGLVGVNGYPAEGGKMAPVEWLKARPNVISLPDGEWANTQEYPMDVAWDGLLVSDQGNARDLVRRVRAVLRLVFGERSEAIEDEMTMALRGDAKKAVSLEEYFANPKHFFASHLKAYSKSRRKAPIYWPVRTRDGGFTAWLYYPRMTKDTLPTLIADVIVPRVAMQRAEVERLRAEQATAEGKLYGTLGKELDAAQELLEGLTDLESRLREVVNAGYTVEHDDGVILSAAPLHDLIPWKELASMFRNITAGKFPWSHQHNVWVRA